MFKKFFILSLCFVSPLLAHADDISMPQQENLPIGRYQICGVNHNGSVKLYLLDTATGLVWRSVTKSNWVEHDHWQLQIANSPVYP
jgi:hypothetical protein